MHRLQNRVYAGSPGETVTVRTTVQEGGAVTVVIDGINSDQNPTFSLKPNPGDETHMRVALLGAVGESCVVSISEVDGGSDGDLLLCQSLDPAPIHLYRFIVTSARAMRTLQDIVRRGAPAPSTARIERTEQRPAESSRKSGSSRRSSRRKK
jgi:hypothetical protein